MVLFGAVLAVLLVGAGWNYQRSHTGTFSFIAPASWKGYTEKKTVSSDGYESVEFYLPLSKPLNGSSTYRIGALYVVPLSVWDKEKDDRSSVEASMKWAGTKELKRDKKNAYVFYGYSVYLGSDCVKSPFKADYRELCEANLEAQSVSSDNLVLGGQ